jgi:uncharacterized protein YjeT (DUF2065 family)
VQARTHHISDKILVVNLNSLNITLSCFFLSALGLMMVFEGIPYFCFPQKVKILAKKLPEIPDSTLRVIGFFLMMIGLLVVYLGGEQNV